MSNCCKDLMTLCGKDKEHCFDSTSTSAKENGKSFYLKTQEKSKFSTCKIHIDGCLIDSQTQGKCDYLFKVCSNNDFYFVELKGKNIERAYNQIKATVQQLQKKLGLTKKNIIGVIVASSTPSFNSTSKNLQESFKKDLGKELKIRTATCEIVI